ncbi:NERD domain-containing protein [Demequina subtropica]|uniref:NERD domain-containing protein n=1 Tax=Demequina subtropica TaxID=1638989 RepID=UPI0007854309|nr:NERD domain-containing protein [Demequina subtropica]
MILIPDLIDIERNATSDAERKLARLLSRVDLDPNAVAFHSVNLRSHEHKQQAEADFVILWRGVVVVVEVKGGGVRKHDGVWYSVNRHGDWKKLRESPMAQAQSAAFALRDILREERTDWFAHEALVVTPDIDSPPHSVEWRATHWLAKDDMNVASLGSALDVVVVGARSAPTGQKRARPDELRARLFGEFTRVPVIDAQRGAVIEEQNRATEGQARVLAALARNPRVLASGGAGTGKSLILAEGAKQEAEQGREVLITFGSPGLVGFFAPRIAGRDIALLPFHELRGDEQYDVVFVDEAQDLMTPEGMDRIDAVVKGGRSGGRWRMFLDPNNQAHVDGAFDEDVLAIVSEDAASFDLDLNVRNTGAIVHVVQQYLGADVGDPGIVHGEKVQWHTPDGPADLGAAEEVAARLVADGATRSEIWIVLTSATEAPHISDRGFTVTSPRFAKGLEAEHVIVCDLPRVFNDVARAAFYVAVTRARVSLHIVTTNDDKKNLQQLIRKQLMAK